MNNYLRISAWLLLILATSSCREGTKEPTEKPEVKGLWDSHIVASSERAEGGLDHLEEYLGYGCDLTKEPSTNPKGMVYKVIELNQEAWSPFGLAPTTLKPRLQRLKLEAKTRFARKHQVLSEIIADKDSLVLHLAGEKKVEIPLLASSLLERRERDNYARSILQHIKEVIYYDNFTPEVLTSYLRPSFVRSLKVDDAEDLVSFYGTHLVGRYNLGAVLDFELHSDPYIFTEEETREIERWLWDSSYKSYNSSIMERLRPYVLSYHYRQIGSKDFLKVDNHIMWGTLDEMLKNNDEINVAQWENGLFDGLNFVSLDEEQKGLIPIPDLITDIPLKVKYTAGILHRSMRSITLGKSSQITYLLSDPKTFEPIQVEGKSITLVLDSYKDEQTYLYLDSFRSDEFLKASMVKGLKDSDTSILRWDFRLQPNGLWLIRCLADYNDLFFCRDMKLRSKEEDKDGLRFWGLNPIIPDKNGKVLFDVEKRLI